tara:strand:- start:4459 stop:4683 length:225 start_codon:yes stop_codon:yes gene_type:complete
MTLEAECRDCAGTGFVTKRNPHKLLPGLHEVVCETCTGAGWIECDRGGVDCPFKGGCYCEAAWEKQEADKMEKG